MNKKGYSIFLIISFMGLSLFTACGPSDSDSGVETVPIPVTIDPNLPSLEPTEASATASENQETLTIAESGYPSPEDGYPSPDYPGPAASQDSESAVADPDRDLPQPAQDTGVIGGVLAREVFEDGTYIPGQVVSLNLAVTLLDSNGEPAMLRQSDEDLQAELLDTAGLFIFRNVPPGIYGIVANIGITQFPIVDETGETIYIEVVANQVEDIGILTIHLPNSE